MLHKLGISSSEDQATAIHQDLVIPQQPTCDGVNESDGICTLDARARSVWPCVPSSAEKEKERGGSRGRNGSTDVGAR